MRTCRATRRRPGFGRLLAVQGKRPAKEGDVRVTTAFNRMLGLPGAWVRDVAFDLCAWLAQQMSQTQVTKLMRIGWESVGKILERVVADYLDQGRLDGLVQIGVDEGAAQACHCGTSCHATVNVAGTTETSLTSDRKSHACPDVE